MLLRGLLSGGAAGAPARRCPSACRALTGPASRRPAAPRSLSLSQPVCATHAHRLLRSPAQRLPDPAGQVYSVAHATGAYAGQVPLTGEQWKQKKRGAAEKRWAPGPAACAGQRGHHLSRQASPPAPPALLCQSCRDGRSRGGAQQALLCAARQGVARCWRVPACQEAAPRVPKLCPCLLHPPQPLPIFFPSRRRQRLAPDSCPATHPSHLPAATSHPMRGRPCCSTSLSRPASCWAWSRAPASSSPGALGGGA